MQDLMFYSNANESSGLICCGAV